MAVAPTAQSSFKRERGFSITCRRKQELSGSILVVRKARVAEQGIQEEAGKAESLGWWLRGKLSLC